MMGTRPRVRMAEWGSGNMGEWEWNQLELYYITHRETVFLLSPFLTHSLI